MRSGDANVSTSRMRRKRNPRRQQAIKRPYVVAHLVSSFLYHGRYWTVGCLTAEAAEASFRRRVARNLATDGNEGLVVAYRREGREPICWTGNVKDPQRVLDLFFCK